MKKCSQIWAILMVMSSMAMANTIETSKVLEAAQVVRQRNQSLGAGKWFNRDCSGTVNAIFAEAGFPLAKQLNATYKNGMNGTANLHVISKVISYNDIEPGDLVFFDDTYDRNGNGISDDVLTHVGIVTKYNRSSGIVTFIHYNTWMNEIVEQELNLREPSSRESNITLRWPSKNDQQTKRYAGELIHSFGRITTN
jgi:uncharacterized protein YfaT (DUF1175 family)